MRAGLKLWLISYGAYYDKKVIVKSHVYFVINYTLEAQHLECKGDLEHEDPNEKAWEV